ncbi:hypothetical protein AK812_SmicGene13543 [Symbiodinium microadriaticum]|uniref:Uncharacterized protein n=1 Tax=Symbiodinium microadriaticum TaxID=2951 RepID=A0A1Q9E7V3_SYMMI|nr:hypothetical protein AK812_SmicGene13543 [Symbiodinium microadriaticum]CAE7917107.1 unnamed protein product [Symbiodinium sp. KB8]
MRHLCTRNRPETDAVIWATKGQGLYANDTYQRLQLKLVPYGTMSTLKEKPLQTMSKSSCVVQGPAETFFQVSAPKLDLEKLQGLAVPFFHVGQTTEPELAARYRLMLDGGSNLIFEAISSQLPTTSKIALGTAELEIIDVYDKHQIKLGMPEDALPIGALLEANRSKSLFTVSFQKPAGILMTVQGKNQAYHGIAVLSNPFRRPAILGQTNPRGRSSKLLGLCIG